MIKDFFIYIPIFELRHAFKFVPYIIILAWILSTNTPEQKLKSVQLYYIKPFIRYSYNE